MRVLLLQGSMAQPSHTAAMIETVARLLERHGVEPEIWDLRYRPVPVVDAAYHRDPSQHPNPVVKSLVAKANAADGFVLGSPVYHNSYSGVLKNCLDNLTIRQFENKPVALCGNGGRRGSVQAVDHLRIVVRGLHAVAIPYQVVSMDSDYEEGDGAYRIISHDLLKRLDLMVWQLVDYMRRFRNRPDEAARGTG